MMAHFLLLMFAFFFAPCVYFDWFFWLFSVMGYESFVLPAPVLPFDLYSFYIPG